MRKWITFNIFFNLVQGGKKEKKKRTLSDKQLPPFLLWLLYIYNFFYRLSRSIEVIVGAFTWIGSSEINSACS